MRPTISTANAENVADNITANAENQAENIQATAANEAAAVKNEGENKAEADTRALPRTRPTRSRMPRTTPQKAGRNTTEKKKH